MSEPIKSRIVVAIAESQPATVHFAVDEARHFGCDLEVLHCAGYTRYATRVIDQLYFENWREAADHVLDETKASIAREIDPPAATYRMSDHAPLDELLQVSTEAAEIVVGADNPSWFTRVWGPAVAQSIVFASRCPVVVVPEHVPAPSRARGVVVGIEGDHPEEHVLRYAFEHADRRRRKLQVLHALPVDAWVGEVDAHEAAVAAALAGWSEKFPDVDVSRKFVSGKVDRVCARATMSAELVVIGQPHGDRIPFGFDRPLSGALLQRAIGPVAVVPDPASW